MEISANKAGVLGLLSFVRQEFGFDTKQVEAAVLQYMTITTEGIKIRVKLPVGTADILIVPEVGPRGSIKIRLVQIKVLGMGFLVKQLRAIAAKAILARLAAYIDYFATGLTDGNDILLSRADVQVTSVKYAADRLLVVADLPG